MFRRTKSIAFSTTKVGPGGRVTLPVSVRNRLRLKKGQKVVFIELKNGILMQSAEAFTNTALSWIGKELKRKGLTLGQLIKQGRKIRGELLEEEYGLEDEPN